MTAHSHTTLVDGCYRCDLNRDEIAHIEDEVRAEARAAWLEYRDGPMRNWPRRQVRRREFIAGYLAANEMPPSP